MSTLRGLILFFIVTLILPESSWSIEKEHQTFFKFDEYTLTEFQKNRLDKAVQKIIKNEALWVKGFSDPLGEENYNLKLSKKRAQAVRDYISKNYNFDLDKIKLSPIGIDRTAGVKFFLRRRVELFGGTYDEIFGDSDMNIKTETEIDLTDRSLTQVNEEESPLEVSEDVKTEDAAAVERSISSEGQNTFTYEKTKDRYYAFLGAYNNVIEAEDRGTGGLARWISNENIDLQASYQHEFKKNLWIGARASFHIQDYEVELNPLFDWDENTENLFRLSVISDYETEKWGLGFDLDYNGEQFIYEQAFDVELRNIYLFGVSLRAKYKLFSSNNWSSRLGLKLELPLLSGDQIEPKGQAGFFGYIDISKHRWVKKHDIHCRLYYGVRRFANDQNDQNEEIAGFKCGVRSLSWL